MTNPVSQSEPRRKRSAKVALTTMAALGGGAMLSGCGEAGAEQTKPPVEIATAENGKEVQLFDNVFACAKETGMTRAECSDMRNQALAAAEREAPRFAALLDCEQEYGEGKCVEGSEEATGSRSHFSPFLAAFIWSKVNPRPIPAFSSRGGGYQTSNGVRLGYAGSPGRYYAASRAFQAARSIPKVKVASAKAKKGGFGEKSRGWKLASRSGGGSKSKGG